MSYRCLSWLLAAGIALPCACGKKDDGRKPTFPVTGQVYVDGKPPDSPILISCHPVGGIDKANPTVSAARTGDDGKFSISTYKSGDGIPEGEYVLTFYWGKENLFTRSYGGPDRLNGRYKDPKKSPWHITVKAGEPTDMGRIDLTSK